MTTLPLLPLAAALGALALIGFAVLFARRRAAAQLAVVADDDVATDANVSVPFTHLGVDVEAPLAPDWSLRCARSAPLRPQVPLAIADVDRATSILRDHVRAQPTSIAPWLMLLELYRTHGRAQALGELARDFSERFHTQRPGAHALRGGADGGLEAFPPVMRLVTMLWGTHECRDLLGRLLLDRSEGRRLGLSRAAYVDIATLANLLETLLAELDSDRVEEAKVRAAWQTAAYVAQVRAV